MTPARRSSTATGAIRSNVISSQQAHERFGGVVPEIASRHHLELVNADRRAGAASDAGVTLEEVELVAATQGPGSSARCSSASPPPRRSPPPGELPFAPVDHLQGHVAANFLAPAERRAAPRGGAGRSSRRSCA